MRELTDHIVQGDSAKHQLKVSVVDEPGQGGACHRYEISGFDTRTNVSEGRYPHSEAYILFQNGPIKEVGVNGLTHEVLLAIIIDRLASFQDGPFACNENKEAMDHIRLALKYLQSRTAARISRGVEGTHEK